MSAPSITRLARRPCVRARALHGSRPFLAPVRSFAQSPARAWPRKDSQDKDSINTEATEYSKSGTDDAAAQQDEAAFDPSTTDPQKEKKIAGEGNEVCSLLLGTWSSLGDWLKVA